MAQGEHTQREGCGRRGGQGRSRGSVRWRGGIRQGSKSREPIEPEGDPADIPSRTKEDPHGSRSTGTRPKPDSAEIDQTILIQKGTDSVQINQLSPTRRNANEDEGQQRQEAIGGNRSRQGLTRPNRRSIRMIHKIKLKPVSARSGQESNQRTCAVDEGRAVGSMKSFGRSTTIDQGRRCERRIWWIGWLWWFGLKDWACSKWKTKSDNVDEHAEEPS